MSMLRTTRRIALAAAAAALVPVGFAAHAQGQAGFGQAGQLQAGQVGGYGMQPGIGALQGGQAGAYAQQPMGYGAQQFGLQQGQIGGPMQAGQLGGIGAQPSAGFAPGGFAQGAQGGITGQQYLGGYGAMEPQWGQVQAAQIQQGPQAYLGQDVAVQQVFRGIVSDVNLSTGIVRLATDRGTVTLRAKPNQITALRVGEQWTPAIVNFGPQSWVVSNLGAGAPLREFGITGRVTGPIINLDKTAGVVTIRSAGGQTWTFLAHPAEIEPLLPGQWVDVMFQRIGNTYWLMNLSPGGPR